MKSVGVVLSGCGFLDGAELYESVLTLLYLDQAGVHYQCLAPDVSQLHVVDHFKKEPTTESRRVLTEAARVARGKILPLEDIWVEKVDAVIFPGGFGAAKNLCDFAVKGKDCSIHPSVESFMKKLMAAGKPVGLICIAPVVMARALKGTSFHPKMTVGARSGASEALEYFGSTHVVCPVMDDVVDRAAKVVTTPAYMYDARLAEVAQGIEKLVRDVLSLIPA